MPAERSIESCEGGACGEEQKFTTVTPQNKPPSKAAIALMEQRLKQDAQSSIDSKSFKFDKSMRVLKKAEFTAIFNQSQYKASHNHFLVLSRENSRSKARIGLVIGKKHVKLAHQRNLIKRIARETLRLHQHHLPAVDLILIARKGADSHDKTALANLFVDLWNRIAKRYHHDNTLKSTAV